MKTCFVVTPFGGSAEKREEFKAVFSEIIQPVMANLGYHVYRSDTEVIIGDYMGKIIDALVTADLVIADMTDANPNAFYELGIRHALHPSGTILIVNEDDTGKVPSDLLRYYYIKYSNKLSGLQSIRKSLTDQVLAYENITSIVSDNPVYDIAKRRSPLQAGLADQSDAIKPIYDELKRLTKGLSQIRKDGSEGMTVNMGDTYHVGAAGSVGPNSGAHSQNTIANMQDSPIDYSELLSELEKIRTYLKGSNSTDEESDIVLGEVSKAAQAIKAKEPNKALTFLKSCGQKLFEIAKDIGCQVIVGLISKELGLP